MSLRLSERASDRPRSSRSKTRTILQLSKAVAEDRDLIPPDELDFRRPQTRTECRDGLRPCPFVGCKFHLYLDVNPKNGHIKFNFPDQEPWDLEETCVLDLAEQEGGMILEEVGRFLNLTRERVRQVEVKALGKGRIEVEDNTE